MIQRRERNTHETLRKKVAWNVRDLNQRQRNRKKKARDTKKKDT